VAFNTKMLCRRSRERTRPPPTQRHQRIPRLQEARLPRSSLALELRLLEAPIHRAVAAVRHRGSRVNQEMVDPPEPGTAPSALTVWAIAAA
jgi:hypothetical protein